MTVSIHQPNFIPWLGYFYKIYHSDVFVVLDDVEYTKNSYINRNLIKTQHGVKWLTIPVMYSGKSNEFIKDIQIHNFMKEKKRILKTIQMVYSKAPFFDNFFPRLQQILMKNTNSLALINSLIIEWLINLFAFPTKIIYSSTLNIEGVSSQRLINIITSLSGTKYIHGKGGLSYQDKLLFEESKIELIPSKYTTIKYPQLNGEFEPNLSVLDYIFNCGAQNPFKY